MSTTVGAHQWRGLIEEYRDRLPVSDRTPVVSLREGGTPLVHADVLSELTGCEVWIKVEGANPTGSFKDRGMTMAISKAAEAGAKAVICASTGNTSASAAAYAVKAGMVCAVLVPAGKIAIAPPPTVPNPKSISVGGGGTGTAVVKDGPHADLAAEFVAWAKLSKEGNIETWNMLGFDPLNTDVWSDEAVTHNPDNEFVKYFKNNPFEPLLEIKDSIGHLQSFTNPGMPAVNNMLNTQTFNDMFENNVPNADALAQA